MGIDDDQKCAIDTAKCSTRMNCVGGKAAVLERVCAVRKQVVAWEEIFKRFQDQPDPHELRRTDVNNGCGHEGF